MQITLILSHRILKRGVLKDFDLIKLILFSAQSKIHFSENATFFLQGQWGRICRVLGQCGAAAWTQGKAPAVSACQLVTPYKRQMMCKHDSGMGFDLADALKEPRGSERSMD